MFYDIYSQLCKGKGITVSKAALDIGINKSTVTYWKSGEKSPNGNTLNKIAEYFNVTVDYLLGNEKNLTVQDSEIKDELVAFYGNTKKDLTQADIDDIKQLIRLRAELNRSKE